MSNITKRIKIGERELLCSDENMPLTLDGTFVPLKNADGTWNFLTCDLGKKPYFHKFIGTPENVFQKHGYYNMNFNGVCNMWPSGIWPWSAYKCDDGMIFCFCHRELLSRTDPFFCNFFLCGIAVSYDNGENWKYIGDILSTPKNGTNKEVGNMGGIPMYVKDDYIYVYFNDHNAEGTRKIISAARMSLSETIDAVKNEKLPIVKKYSGNGVWNTDPINETGANILPEIGVQPDSHGKGVYCKPLDRFLMALQTHKEGKLVVYMTQDGEHFDEYFIADETGANDLMQPYSFFISADGDCTDDMREVGKEFYIYFPHKGCSSDKPYTYDEFYRRKITIE